MERTIAYAYDVKRKKFGKQPQFNMTHEIMLDSIEPNADDQKRYGLRNPVHRYSQASLSKSEHIINTITVVKRNHGINHAEGGWPKDVHYANEEETLRYRRRIEREDHYVHCIMALTPKFEYYIKQNNAIEIYEQYFKGMQETTIVDKPTVKLNNVYRDSDKRPIAGLCWTIEEDAKLVVTYCNKTYPITGPINTNLVCYIWELENPHNPAFEFIPPAPCWVVACSPANPGIIAGGLDDGRVCVFDIRAEKEPVAISAHHAAHRGPVSALLYIQSRLNNEFFTGSSDGQCMWHDIRNLSEPIETMFMSVKIPHNHNPSFSNTEGVSSLQFERTLPTRFLCGTETGLVLNINRKGKTHSDLMSGVYDAHVGPVRSVHRSPCTSKMFLTCGDWSVNIWSEDIKASPIMKGMTHRYQLMDAAWAPERLSGYMTVSADGKFRFWDLLRRYRNPVISVPVSSYPLLKVVPHEQGRFVAMGGNSGTTFLVSMSKDLAVSGDNDKPLMLQTYERECRREQILQGRLKEIRLKARGDDVQDAAHVEEEYDEEALIKAAEDEYRRQIIDEFRRAGIPLTVTQSDAMRKR